ncbi:SGNH/GDSL hydrolase family protein [Streptomyces thermodiastaticus]|jgi:lysophospholipase L1-like esterase|uniref:SGNH/GDSL hydrolase family protein n=1 Tax=Streptomyces thermodiastaticus TaxID=44061 RepID=UPI0016771A7F|nr:SGNH/GDSL hydrolase family protein [Streptomyces thermodiastaticus]MCE7548726.1 SGNH/GDSL hydrolase family protein [Streptomyces thermodiastaticus]GHF72283.1 lipoprotein [Streptomyces thermodiastaticus]
MRKRRHRLRLARAAVAAAVLASAGCGAAGHTASGRQDSGSGSGQPSATAPAWDTSPDSVAAVGDSITRGFDTCTVLSDCPQSSWATGTDPAVNSLARRLLGASEVTRRSWNHAVTGARMSDLKSQIVKAAVHKPQLVAVMIGANDACRDTVAQMTSVADFRSQFQDAMHTLRAELPTAQVYVASVPNLMRLWSEGRTNPLGKQIWRLGLCPSMLGDADALGAAAAQRRKTVQDRVVAYNAVLKEVCAEDARCRFDDNAVYDYRFGTAQLSRWDWFHPSRDGQARLAEIAYRVVTAERP